MEDAETFETEATPSEAYRAAPSLFDGAYPVVLAAIADLPAEPSEPVI